METLGEDRGLVARDGSEAAQWFPVGGAGVQWLLDEERLLVVVGKEARVMGILRVMTAGGDRSVEWDRRQVEAGDPEARAAVAEAERIFNEARGRGATAFRVVPGHPAERIDRFDLEAEQIVVVPQVVGG